MKTYIAILIAITILWFAAITGILWFAGLGVKPVNQATKNAWTMDMNPKR